MVTNAWLEYMQSPEGQEEREAYDKAIAEHWVHDYLDAPETLIALIETKIARAALASERAHTGDLGTRFRYREEGRQFEQERIVKLLEADMCPDWEDQIPLCCDGACRAYNDAIELIMGEQK